MNQLDVGSAATRSTLGWGVLTGPIYLALGLALALTRDGFELVRHPLSLLRLGDGGWMQRTNLAQSGVGVALLWVAAVASYGWLAAACIYLWPIVPHPVLDRREIKPTIRSI